MIWESADSRKASEAGVENAANRSLDTRNAASDYHKVLRHSMARRRPGALVPIDFGDELSPPGRTGEHTAELQAREESGSVGAVSAPESISTREAGQSRLNVPGPRAEPLSRMACRLAGHRPLPGRAASLTGAIGERLTRDRACFQDSPALPPRSAPDARPLAEGNSRRQELASQPNLGRKKLGGSGRRSWIRLP